MDFRKVGDGGFKSIGAALAAIPAEEPALLRIANGLYREKLFIDRPWYALMGEDSSRTIIEWDDGARKPHPDGRPTGTFRSYTAFLGGGFALVKNLTIRNAAGPGSTAGQAVAAYVDARAARFEGARLQGRQDTLFLAPLPPCERIPGGFLGPRQDAPRLLCTHHFDRCSICGDVDFIFGGARALFTRCQILSLARGESPDGYITAASTPQGQDAGFLFDRCELLSDGAARVYLGRPWREFAHVTFSGCAMGSHILPAGWDDWGRPENQRTALFEETGSAGPGAAGPRAPWSRDISPPDVAHMRAAVLDTVRRALPAPLAALGNGG